MNMDMGMGAQSSIPLQLQQRHEGDGSKDSELYMSFIAAQKLKSHPLQASGRLELDYLPPVLM